MARWQDYGDTAIRDLYPHLRDGVDYFWGTQDPTVPPALLGDVSGEINVAAVQARAERLLGEDPYAVYDPSADPSEDPPALTGIDPTSCAADAAAFTLTAIGAGFTETSEIVFNSTAVPTTFVDETSLTASIDPVAMGLAAGKVAVQVQDGARVSNGVAFEITGAAAPPVLTSLTPSSVTAATDTTVTAAGSGFTSDAVVHIDAAAATTTFVSDTSLTFQTGAALVAGTPAVTVVQASGTSAAVTLTVA